VTKGDYAINWRFSVPESLQDKYITDFDLSKSNRVIGNLDLVVYAQPTDDLYLALKGRPAGVFSYDVDMKRRPLESLNTITYPYVKDSDNPVELQKYFGY